jgi:ubiquinone/menaquinone biosynthesis C-methylase UbiE
MAIVTDRSLIVLNDEEDRIKSAYANRCATSLYSWFNSGQLFRIQQLERQILTILRSRGTYPLTDKTILEIGCGNGYWLREFVKWGGCPNNITGVDLLQDRVARARELSPQKIEIQCANATSLALHDRSFDLVCQFTVFTSVLDWNTKKRMALEMLRVVKEAGTIIWYDYHTNNPRNRDVRGIRKQEIAELFPDCYIELQRVTLAPPLARFLAPYSWLTCYALEHVKIFNTHYLGVIRKR